MPRSPDAATLDGAPADGPAAGPGLVLAVLACGQFVMTLDSSVMNVSMAVVADDIGTNITGIQSAITLYTLVMASTMIAGGTVGRILGRRRAFGLGLLIYAAGSLTTALAPNLAVLLFGWSLLEGLGAALILPAIVALVASNFAPEQRAGAYGLVAASGAIAVAAGPLIGGAVTTYASWRYVFVAEVVLVLMIILLLRKLHDVPAEPARLDVPGAVLSILMMSLIVFGALRSTDWGWVRPQPGGPSLLGASPVIWMILSGVLVGFVFLWWQNRQEEAGGQPLVRPSMFATRQLTGGLTMFFAQFAVQSGVFFAVPLFLSVVLGLNSLETGIRLIPLSLALLVSAAGLPRVAPDANPRTVVRVGLGLMVFGAVLLMAGMDPGAGAAVVSVPMLLMGLGIGALASQLGAVTVSSMPDEYSAEIGGLQNTATNLGASLGTALIGSVLIATLTAGWTSGIQADPKIPTSVKQAAATEITGSVPFLSDVQLEAELRKTALTEDVIGAVIEANEEARLQALRSAFALAALLGAIALLLTGRLPTSPPSARTVSAPAGRPPAD